MQDSQQFSGVLTALAMNACTLFVMKLVSSVYCPFASRIGFVYGVGVNAPMLSCNAFECLATKQQLMMRLHLPMLLIHRFPTSTAMQFRCMTLKPPSPPPPSGLPHNTTHAHRAPHPPLGSMGSMCSGVVTLSIRVFLSMCCSSLAGSVLYSWIQDLCA